MKLTVGPVVDSLLGGEKRGQAFISPCSTYFFSQFLTRQANSLAPWQVNGA